MVFSLGVDDAVLASSVTSTAARVARWLRRAAGAGARAVATRCPLLADTDESRADTALVERRYVVRGTG